MINTFKLLLIFFLFLGCSDSETNDKNNENVSSENSEVEFFKTENSSQVKDIETCDEFLDSYEEWMDTYIKILAKYKDDPVGLATSKEYNKLIKEAVNWATLWGRNHFMCAQNEKYAKRFNEIQERSVQKQKELGLKK